MSKDLSQYYYVLNEGYGYNIMTLNYQGKRFCYKNFGSKELLQAIESLHEYQRNNDNPDKEIWLEHKTMSANKETIYTRITEEEMQKTQQCDTNVKAFVGVVLFVAGIALFATCGWFLGFLVVGAAAICFG
jgi:hypothetical protein